MAFLPFFMLQAGAKSGIESALQRLNQEERTDAIISTLAPKVRTMVFDSRSICAEFLSITRPALREEAIPVVYECIPLHITIDTGDDE